MMTSKHTKFALFLPFILLVITGCGGPHVHKDERFELDSQYQRSYGTSPERACHGARRALLSQGYTLDDNLAESVAAHKSFDPDDEVMTVLEFTVTCLPHAKGAVIYANAEESIYRLKKTAGSVGLGVSSVGSIKLPWGKQLDSLIKTSGATIDNKKFYKRFFNLIEELIASAGPGRSRGLR